MSTPELIPLTCDAGRTLLLEADVQESWWQLNPHFVTQDNLAYCGIASSTMVLNALDIEAPVSPVHAPFCYFTQDNFFTPAVTQVKTAELVAQEGLSLAELQTVLKAHGLLVDAHYAQESDADHFRQQLQHHLDSTDSFILANYHRASMGQERGGHISPLAAYHQATDRVLIMDVSRYKYPPIWIAITDFWHALANATPGTELGRGWLTMSRSIGTE